MIKYFPLLLLGILASGCFDKGDCVRTATNIVQIRLLSKADRMESKIKFNSVTVSGSNGVRYKDQEVSSLLLPVNPGQDTVTFTLNYGTTVSTITVGYTQETRVISVDCGAFTYYKDLKIVSSSFDETQIRLVTPVLLQDFTTKAYANNVEIYF